MCYCDAWSKRRNNNTISKHILEETKNKYSWNIPDQPTKRDIRKWEKENNVVLGVWSITNQTEKMKAKQFVEHRRPWIVPQDNQRKQKENNLFSYFLDFLQQMIIPKMGMIKN